MSEISFSSLPFSTRVISKYKRYGYWLAILALALMPVAGYYIGDNTQWTLLRTWFLPIFIFGVLPIADHIIGEDPTNFSEQEMHVMANDKYYRFITLTVLPIYAALLVWGMYALVYWENLSVLESLGWIVSIGLYGGAIGITTAHELIHKNNKFEKAAGGLLLSLVSYAGFKIEHVYGHHVHVSTPEDNSSSRYNQSIYTFLLDAYMKNFINAWKLQKKLLNKRGFKFISLRNELIYYYVFTLLVLCGFIVWQGALGAVYFLLSSLVAFTLLEVVNYIEHYGLHREKLESGRYERVNPQHSWNSNHLMTNLFLFHLQRHSDHHAYPNRRYQVLRNFDDIPQLPSGYALMILLALVPALWKKVMNPRVQDYYKGRMDILQNK
jgi:alkane 1-monooxygenase